MSNRGDHGELFSEEFNFLCKIEDHYKPLAFGGRIWYHIRVSPERAEWPWRDKSPHEQTNNKETDDDGCCACRGDWCAGRDGNGWRLNVKPEIGEMFGGAAEILV